MDSANNKQPDQEQWKRNLRVLWFGTFLFGLAFSEIMPFLSLYIRDLGHYSKGMLSIYSGLAFGATYVVSAIVSPMWGTLADRTGRKPMLLRASLGMGIIIALMGLVTNVWELIGLRALEGLVSGFVSNAQALIATQVPARQSGKALGTLQTGTVGGMLFGPLIGGALAQFVGYRPVFFITGFLILIVFFIVLFEVKEDFAPVKRQDMKSTKEVIRTIKHPRLILAMFITTLIIQAGNYSISPIISLYVSQIMHHSSMVSFYAGIVAAAPGLATVLAASRLGDLGDHIGTELILSLGFILAIIFYVPMAFVTNVWQLIFLRFCIGIANASMLPSVQAIITQNIPHSVTGRIFSWNQSFQYIGTVLGSLLGSVVAAVFNYNMVFITTAILVVINFGWVWFNTGEQRRKHLKQLKER
ncbi:major facilitator superfamily protein [Lactobacillus selangorensis]|uniref:Major facilitator superfamily protein n=1 Tax=Lactobacillus selangorensis TaxID=81857 RepID=A0A0R2FKB0_9LACO|nr:multidrug efflux MFS transporter [Lactobacillus selangorensis]KRN28139.1 major facilitator superfamily protein [Lactobacillus selangorensis]KRN30984.1 major facilitator superfamily protein [Lactobacillus selangorensis]